ncbi:electron transfer flavoprotein beta subunit lysine methyltransferase isoform X3 [Manis pentadactyla]|uniref:electron transfer flavoprotein beta subunit lysine methyltransferase isoform X3 n=1 Tax=Manis pentadactyla TaxID=143292 RepID=UPI00255CB7DD|nr:electron transfer flavoprotein beta subunit lysine methyltransferase isoform X3 [Manis pentadactyla]
MAWSLGWRAFALLAMNRWGVFRKTAGRCSPPLFSWGHCPWRGTESFLDPEMKAFLEANTEVTRSGSLTPEIQLRLLTPRCKFWWERADRWPHGDPYWAIYWPGGQALSRYFLDNPDIVRGKSVLDLGSGCGATAIAAKMSGASRILASDIDPNSLHQWLKNCFRAHRTRVLIGDPGRPQFSGHSIRHQLHKVVEYSLPETTRQENNGLTTSTVWDFQP